VLYLAAQRFGLAAQNLGGIDPLIMGVAVENSLAKRA
jgi:hypothetical protein